MIVRCILVRVMPGVPENVPAFNNDRDSRREKVARMLAKVREENPRTIDQIRLFIVNWRRSVGALTSFTFASLWQYGSCVVQAKNQGLNWRQAFVTGGHIFVTEKLPALRDAAYVVVAFGAEQIVIGTQPDEGITWALGPIVYTVVFVLLVNRGREKPRRTLCSAGYTGIEDQEFLQDLFPERFYDFY